MNFLIAGFLVFFSITALCEEGAVVTLLPHTPPAEAVHCQDCHAKKNKEFILSKKKTTLKHENFAGKHGRTDVACGGCHDRNNSNFLRSTPDARASFVNPSPVCKQCHQDRYKDWEIGIHGKRLGGWNIGKKQLHCIECHGPHSVRFKTMKAEPAPIKPKLGIEKETE